MLGDEGERRDISFVSIEAALSRANTLTLIVRVQDAISRVGAVLIAAVTFGGEGWLRSAVPLLVLGAVWMISKSTLDGMVDRIEQSFVARALRNEDTDESTKWEHLAVMLGTHESATPMRLMAARILAFEPLLLTGLLAALGIAL